MNNNEIIPIQRLPDAKFPIKLPATMKRRLPEESATKGVPQLRGIVLPKLSTIIIVYLLIKLTIKVIRKIRGRNQEQPPQLIQMAPEAEFIN